MDTLQDRPSVDCSFRLQQDDALQRILPPATPTPTRHADFHRRIFFSIGQHRSKDISVVYVLVVSLVMENPSFRPPGGSELWSDAVVSAGQGERVLVLRFRISNHLLECLIVCAFNHILWSPASCTAETPSCCQTPSVIYAHTRSTIRWGQRYYSRHAALLNSLCNSQNDT